MSIVTLFIVGSLVVVGMILFTPAKVGEDKPWLLRTSWALWCLQPVLFFSSLILGLTILDRMGYANTTAPDDVQAWLSVLLLAPCGVLLLAGTITGGLAWRQAQLETPPTGHRWWALGAMAVNVLWFGVGIWGFGALPVAIVADVVILALALGLLLWPQRQVDLALTLDAPTQAPPSPVDGPVDLSVPADVEPVVQAETAADDHLVG